MRAAFRLFAVCWTVFYVYTCCGTVRSEELDEDKEKWPSIAISILVKNKELALPYSLSCLEKLDYPKDRIYIWFYLDSSVDDSSAIVETWINKHKNKYNKVYVEGDKTKATEGKTETRWTEERLIYIIGLREKALNFARKSWADYLFMVDADIFVTNPATLKHLISKKLPIVAPMMTSDTRYSNFWSAMSPKYYYEKTDQYEKIIYRDESTLNCFEVPMVHSAVLIDLRLTSSDQLTYTPSKISGYTGPVDDIIAFAISAKNNGITMSVCNDLLYGFLPVPMDMATISFDSTEEEQLLNVKMEALSQGVMFPLDPDLAKYVTYPKPDKLGLDRVFMINLERRPERRHRMLAGFKELGVDAVLVKAFDGSLLDIDDLDKYSITLMPNYEDPYHKRPMKTGEVGCFLSHYGIWKEIAARHIPRSLILEDDIKFAPFFRRRLQDLLEDLESIDWEFVYIGRKILDDSSEKFVSNLVTRPRYSYWTIGYLLSESGARRLIQAEPLTKMLPIDEFLPIMFDQHPNETWKSFFRKRELKAFSADPLLVWPTHYTGEEGYQSDTEDSAVVALKCPEADEFGPYRAVIPAPGSQIICHMLRGALVAIVALILFELYVYIKQRRPSTTCPVEVWMVIEIVIEDDFEMVDSIEVRHLDPIVVVITTTMDANDEAHDDPAPERDNDIFYDIPED